MPAPLKAGGRDGADDVVGVDLEIEEDDNSGASNLGTCE